LQHSEVQHRLPACLRHKQLQQLAAEVLAELGSLQHRVDARGAGRQPVALLLLQPVALQVVMVLLRWLLQHQRLLIPLPGQPLLFQKLQQQVPPPRPPLLRAAAINLNHRSCS
jgi:hypothetical protein